MNQKIDEIHEQTCLSFTEKLESVLIDHLKELDSSTHPKNGYIRLISHNIESIFIRMLPTTDYQTGNEINYVNAYIHYVKNKKHKNTLLFSNRLDNETIQYVSKYIATIASELFYNEDKNGNKSYDTKVIGYFGDSVTIKQVDLEKEYSKALKDKETFLGFFRALLHKLDSNNPYLYVQFECNVANVHPDPTDDMYIGDGKFAITFTYNPGLSHYYQCNTISIDGTIPGMTEDGVYYVKETINIDRESEMDNTIWPLFAWYFSLRKVLHCDESLKILINELPYYMKVI